MSDDDHQALIKKWEEELKECQNVDLLTLDLKNNESSLHPYTPYTVPGAWDRIRLFKKKVSKPSFYRELINRPRFRAAYPRCRAPDPPPPVESLSLAELYKLSGELSRELGNENHQARIKKWGEELIEARSSPPSGRESSLQPLPNRGWTPIELFFEKVSKPSVYRELAGRRARDRGLPWEELSLAELYLLSGELSRDLATDQATDQPTEAQMRAYPVTDYQPTEAQIRAYPGAPPAPPKTFVPRVLVELVGGVLGYVGLFIVFYIFATFVGNCRGGASYY
jgi:hypothetical protein